MKKIAFLTLLTIILYLLIPESGYAQKKKTEDPDEIRKPVINYAEFTANDEKALYKSCIISLHQANIDIDALRTSYGKDEGLIYSDSIKYKIPADFRASYKLSVLVYKINENKLALHIIVIRPMILIKSMYVGKYTINGFNNIIAADIEKFLENLATLQSKADLTKTTMIDIQYNGL